jgi:hypothetical protein
MLEPHLSEIKHEEESKLRHPEPPVQSFSTPCHTEKIGGLSCCQMPAKNMLGRYLADQQQDGWWATELISRT